MEEKSAQNLTMPVLGRGERVPPGIISRITEKLDRKDRASGGASQVLTPPNNAKGQYFQIVEEKADYLICKQYDFKTLRAGTVSFNVAKPWFLRKAPFHSDDASITRDGFAYEYDAENPSKRTRTNTSTDETAVETVSPTYVAGDIVLGIKRGRDIGLTDDRSTAIEWEETNATGRVWQEDLQILRGTVTDATADAEVIDIFGNGYDQTATETGIDATRIDTETENLSDDDKVIVFKIGTTYLINNIGVGGGDLNVGATSPTNITDDTDTVTADNPFSIVEIASTKYLALDIDKIALIDGSVTQLLKELLTVKSVDSADRICLKKDFYIDDDTNQEPTDWKRDSTGGRFLPQTAFLDA